MFLLNVCLKICCDIFRDTQIGSDVIHATPIQINYFLQFKDLRPCGPTFHSTKLWAAAFKII